jgi:hypothetical protein
MLMDSDLTGIGEFLKGLHNKGVFFLRGPLFQEELTLIVVVHIVYSFIGTLSHPCQRQDLRHVRSSQHMFCIVYQVPLDSVLFDLLFSCFCELIPRSERLSSDRRLGERFLRHFWSIQFRVLSIEFAYCNSDDSHLFFLVPLLPEDLTLHQLVECQFVLGSHTLEFLLELFLL